MYEPNKTMLYSDSKSEITYESADANGWYHVTVDCAVFNHSYTRKLSIGGYKSYTPTIWIDELTFIEKNTTEPNDLSDKMVGSETGTVSLDNDVSYDGIQSMKITGVPSYAEAGTTEYNYSLAFYYGSYDFVGNGKLGLIPMANAYYTEY